MQCYECELIHDVDDYFADEENNDERADRLNAKDEFNESLKEDLYEYYY